MTPHEQIERILAPIKSAPPQDRARLWWNFDMLVMELQPREVDDFTVTQLHVQRARCLTWELIGDKLVAECDEFEVMARIAHGMAETEARSRLANT